MTRYAQNTEVSSDRSRAEIERTLTRYGATGFAYAWSGHSAMIAFEVGNRQVKFMLPLANPLSERFWQTPTGRVRSATQAEAAYKQEVRQRWRALALVIKAKLEAVEAGITIFEEEFLAHIVVPGTGRTVAQDVLPRLAEAYETGKAQPLLPHLP